MTAFQTQTFIPQDGHLSITLPDFFRGTDVKLFVTKTEYSASGMSKEEYLSLLDSYRGTLCSMDYSDLRDEEDREI